MAALIPDNGSTIAVFDGHNDVLSRLLREGADGAEHRFITGAPAMHIDLPRARAAGLRGGLCAVYVSSPASEPDQNGDLPRVERHSALDQTIAQVALLRRIQMHSGGQLSLCRSVADIHAAAQENSFAAVLHIEGIEAAGPDLNLIHVLHAAGLRSLGPVWSRPNIFGHGVPFRFGHDPDIGPGLTAAGVELIHLCNRLRIMIDLSHLNAAGFRDIERLSDAPLVASHSNAYSICPHSRNATDWQLDAIRASGGLIGLNFGVRFLDPAGKADSGLDIAVMVQHIGYLVERVGIDHVGLGSDFDGTLIADQIGDVGGLPRLFTALRMAGFSETEIRKLARDNWLNVLEKTWGE
jgi:membrane dipeptidase